MFYFTEGLISSAKRSEFFPTGQVTFTDPDDLIAFANEEMMTKMVPHLMSVRQDIFLKYKISYIQNLLAHYAFPERAIGNAFKDVFYLPQASNPLLASELATRCGLTKRQIHDIRNGSQSGGRPFSFSLQGDELVLDPVPNSTVGALLFYYYQRPNELVSVTNCAKITGLSSSLGITTFTVDTDLTGSLSVGSKADFISVTSPFLLWAQDVAITTITATTIAVTSTNVMDETSTVQPAIGDYICPAQKTCIPQIPCEFHPILAEMICYRALKAMGRQNQMQACVANITQMLKGAFTLVSNRVEAEVDVIYDDNSLLNSISGPRAWPSV